MTPQIRLYERREPRLAVIGIILLFILAAILTAVLPSCVGSPEPAQPSVALPPTDTAPFVLEHAGGDLDLSARVASGRLRIVAHNYALHADGTTQRVASEADALVKGEGWGYCLALEVYVDARPGLLLALMHLFGDRVAELVAGPLSRGDLDIRGAVVAVPPETMPACERQFGALAVSAAGIDLMLVHRLFTAGAASRSADPAPAATGVE